MLELVHLGRHRVGVGGVAGEHVHRHRAALTIGDQAKLDLG